MERNFGKAIKSNENNIQKCGSLKACRRREKYQFFVERQATKRAVGKRPKLSLVPQSHLIIACTLVNIIWLSSGLIAAISDRLCTCPKIRKFNYVWSNSP